MMHSKEWHDERKTGVGGSDIGAILGLNPWKTPFDVWEEKTGRRPPLETTPQMERGNVLEPVIAKLYQEQTGRLVQRRNDVFRNEEHPLIMAHIDRALLKEAKLPGVGCLEIKAPNNHTFRKMLHYGLPEMYVLQLQHNMLASGFDWGAFAVLGTDQWKLLDFDVLPDDDLRAAIIEGVEEFWQYVESDTPPPPHDKEIKVPEVGNSDLVRMEGDAWIAAINQLKEARELESDAKAIHEAAKLAVQEIMGDNEICEGAGARIYWKTGKPRKIN